MVNLYEDHNIKVESLTERGKKVRRYLEYCLYIFAILVLFKIFYLFIYTHFVSDALIFLFLLLSVLYLNYTYTTILIFLGFINTFYCFEVGAMLLQNHLFELDKYFDAFEGYYTLFSCYNLIMLLFFIFLTGCAHEAYKEFKAIYEESHLEETSQYNLL